MRKGTKARATDGLQMTYGHVQQQIALAAVDHTELRIAPPISIFPHTRHQYFGFQGHPEELSLSLHPWPELMSKTPSYSLILNPVEWR